jgi:hypothetical protein
LVAFFLLWNIYEPLYTYGSSLSNQTLSFGPNLPPPFSPPKRMDNKKDSEDEDAKDAPAARAQQVLTYNVLLDQSQLPYVRHNIFDFSRESPWPPSAWKPGQTRCWHCVRTLDTTPVPLAQGQDPHSGLFIVYGLFCRWGCAKQYLLESQPWASSEKVFLLEELAHSFGYHEYIVPSPPRHSLDIFGGPFSTESLPTGTIVASSPPVIISPLVYHFKSEELAEESRPTWLHRPSERVLTQNMLEERNPGSASSPQTVTSVYAQFLHRHGLAPPQTPGTQTKEIATSLPDQDTATAVAAMPARASKRDLAGASKDTEASSKEVDTSLASASLADAMPGLVGGSL